MTTHIYTHIYTHRIPCWPTYHLKSNYLLFRASNLVFYIIIEYACRLPVSPLTNIRTCYKLQHLYEQKLCLEYLLWSIPHLDCELLHVPACCAWPSQFPYTHVHTHSYEHHTHEHTDTTHTHTHAHHTASSPGHTRLFKMLFSILRAILKRREWLGDEQATPHAWHIYSTHTPHELLTLYEVIHTCININEKWFWWYVHHFYIHASV